MKRRLAFQSSTPELKPELQSRALGGPPMPNLCSRPPPRVLAPDGARPPHDPGDQGCAGRAVPPLGARVCNPFRTSRRRPARSGERRCGASPLRPLRARGGGTHLSIDRPATSPRQARPRKGGFEKAGGGLVGVPRPRAVLSRRSPCAHGRSSGCG